MIGIISGPVSSFKMLLHKYLERFPSAAADTVPTAPPAAELVLPVTKDRRSAAAGEAEAYAVTASSHVAAVTVLIG